MGNSTKPWKARVKAVREKLGMNQANFATRVGVSSHTIRAWERFNEEPFSRSAQKFLKLEKEVMG